MGPLLVWLGLVVEGVAVKQPIPPTPVAVSPGGPFSSPAPGPSGLPHFSAASYGQLRNSGDRVTGAIQNILSVQGSLDELKEDLSTEYARWQARQKELVAERAALEKEIQGYQAQLLEQKSLRALAARLQGDYQLVLKENYDRSQSCEADKAKWTAKQEALQREIDEVLSEINQTHQTREKTLAELHNNTEAMRQRQTHLTEQIILANKTFADVSESRDKLAIISSRQQTALLKQSATLKDEVDKVTKVIEEQQRVQWEHNRLADQARQVASERDELLQDRLDCDAKVKALNDQLRTTAENMQSDTEALRACQLLEAENSKLQEKINACRAAMRAGE